ncbi:MAG: TerB family tellurite resistance protein [Bacteroidales bacterium]|nr:TerB family tellurite resistance protein [Bacteroidales bacterium]
MGKFGKWIGGGLGWAFLGPLGGVLGFVIGSIYDKADDVKQLKPGQTTRGDFTVSLLVLLAAVMKADGKVVRSELDYVKEYLRRSMGPEGAREAVIMLRDILKQNIPVQDVSLQISRYLDYPSRLQLLHLLYGLSGADKIMHPKELEMIDLIARNMGVSETDRQSIKSMFVPDTDAAYRILGLDRTATDEEVKKAYHKMAVEYHPDKVSYLGEEFQKVAKEKFQKINEAYETIRKERGIK